MKKSIFLFLFIFCAFIISAQNVIKNAAENLAKDTYTVLKKSDIKSDAKIVVMNFTLSNSFSDTIISKLGIDFTKSFTQHLQAKIQQKGEDYKILTSNKSAEEQMKNYYSSNQTQKPTDFWKDFIKNQTPDFYIVGSYKIDDNFSTFKSINVKIKSNNFDFDNNNEFVAKDITTEIKTKQDGLYLLEYQTVNTIPELAEFISFQIRFQTNIKNIALSNITFEQTDFTSKFSLMLTDEIEVFLTKNNYNVARNNTRSIFNRVDKTLHYLQGNYTEIDDKIKVNMKLINSKTNTTISAVSCILEKSYLEQENISYKPENIEKAVTDQEIIDNDKFKNDFEIDVWTNKGNDNLVFEENEELQFTVITNQACYFRFIYKLADGNYVLLMDNIKIDQSKINKPYVIQDRFECAEPFGIETLIVNAKTVKFEPLDTYMQYGYNFINNDLEDILRNSRGFKTKVSRAEKILNFTTIPKY